MESKGWRRIENICLTSIYALGAVLIVSGLVWIFILLAGAAAEGRHIPWPILGFIGVVLTFVILFGVGMAAKVIADKKSRQERADKLFPSRPRGSFPA